MKLMYGSSIELNFLRNPSINENFDMQRDHELGSIEIWYKKKNLWQKLLMSDNNNKIWLENYYRRIFASKFWKKKMDSQVNFSNEIVFEA